jgi:hypothetical protein
MKKMTEQFYKDNPELVKHTDIAKSIMQEIEENNPGKPSKDIIAEAKPLIEKRIKAVESMGMTKPDKPTDLTYNKIDTGVL